MTNEPQPEEKNVFPAIYDEKIRLKLEKLSLDVLKEISEISGTTMNSGYLMSNPNENSREVYIEEISEIGDKAQWQIDRLYEALLIEK